MARYVRIDGGIVVEIIALPNGISVADAFPAEIVETLRATDEAQVGWVVKGQKLVAPPEPDAMVEVVLKRLHKATLWRRLTEDEAEALDIALAQAPVRLRRIFEAAQYLDTADGDYPALRAGVEAALGKSRTDAALEPDH